jgi:hypothetical protein
VAARFDQWTARRNPDGSADEIRAQTLAFMATMPAWKKHPQVAGTQA